MKLSRVVLTATLSSFTAVAGVAQGPPSSPVAPRVSSGQAVTHNSRVSTLIYGPQGGLQAVVLRDGIAVTVSPDLGTRLQPFVRKGTRLQVSGTQQVINGQFSMVAQSVRANGQAFAATLAPPSAGPGPGPGLAANAPPPPVPCGAAPPLPPPASVAGALPRPSGPASFPATPGAAAPPPSATTPPPPPPMPSQNQE